MKKYIATLIAIPILLLSACSTKDKYDVARYYDPHEQDSLLIGIVTHIFDAPPSTPINERFEEKHRPFYSKISTQCSILKYYIADDGTHYYYVMRPGWGPSNKRGAGGYFKMDKNFKIKNFREVFVTPMLAEEEVKGRCAFLFNEMVNHSVDKYLSMPTYVQWPNAITYYDTLIYQWKLKPGTSISN